MIFGESTGIEVSTVVAMATVGNSVYKKQFAANIHKLELICAGVVACVGVLFGNPLVGFLFALEVIARKFSKTLLISCSASALLSLLFLFALILLKPLASSLTLGAGGDGGVFAPSIVVGAYLGLAFAMACNTFFGTSLILINFVLIGIAATLSAAIYAPFTALILTCSLVPNGYALFFPILLGCIFSAENSAKNLALQRLHLCNESLD